MRQPVHAGCVATRLRAGRPRVRPAEAAQRVAARTCSPCSMTGATMATVCVRLAAREGERRAAPAAPRRAAPPRLHASCRAAGAACGAGCTAPSSMPALARASPPRCAATQLHCAAPSVAMESRTRDAPRNARWTAMPRQSAKNSARRSAPMAADTLAASTDFSKAVFSNKEEVAAAVVDQYDDEKTRIFYKLVMGAPGAAACSTQQRSLKRVRAVRRRRRRRVHPLRHLPLAD